MSSPQVYFPCSHWYAPASLRREAVVCESGVRGRGRVFGYTERHVQAVWFDPVWRPVELVTANGERVVVEYPGRWNLESGPDFLDAVLRVGPDLRRISGDVEIHVFPSDWRHHRHQEDPRYQRVCAHVTYFEGVLAPDELPAGALQVALRPALRVNPLFAFEHVDVTAYPYAGRSEVPPCRSVFARWPVEERALLLESAGQVRLRLKSDRLAEAMAERGEDQILYEAVMAALGYQHNKRPMVALASKLPVGTLRQRSQGDVLRAYALLAGLSGLLPAEVATEWDAETRSFVRSLWDIWWRERDALPPPLERSAWHLHSIRPMNHPMRRLMAAAAVFNTDRSAHRMISDWLASSARETLDRLTASLGGVAAPYWPHRDGLGGARRARPAVLLGRDRIEVLMVNVLLPMATALGFHPDLVAANLNGIRPEPVNQIMKQTAFYLLGPDHPATLLGTASSRQGLLQIFHDHCLHDRSHCARCSFPGWLETNRRPVDGCPGGLCC